MEKKRAKKERKKKKKKKKSAKNRAPSPASLEILPASDSELRPRRSSGVRLAYTDPSGERQRAPSTPRWGPSTLQEILPARDSELSPRRSSSEVRLAYTDPSGERQREHRPRRNSRVRLAYTDPSGERQRAPSTPRWGPSSLQRCFRRTTASTVHAAVGSV